MTSALFLCAAPLGNTDQLQVNQNPPSPSEASAGSAAMYAPAANLHASDSHTPTLSTKLNGVAFEVSWGDLTDEKTDAIVNPTDDEFMLRSNLSKEIVSKGGSIITEECRTCGRIPAGGTVVTSGGELSCRHVVHVVSPDDLQECERAVRAIIQAAVANEFKSISFPHFRGKRLQLDQMAGCVVDTLADSANQKITGSLTLVRLVGYSVPIEKAFRAALTQAMLGNRNLKAQNAITQAICGKQKRKAKTAIKSFTNDIVINGVLIEVLQGDITCESTELIANPTDEDLKLTGNLSKALIAVWIFIRRGMQRNRQVK